MLQDLKKYWKNDLVAAISVSLVALPLGLGIAIASEAPPISGLISAIVGGLVTTFIRGSKLAINGPGAGAIVVILTGNHMLADPGQSGFPYVLAAICIAGALQVVMGLLKLGRLGEVVPSSVVHGMLAAIGVIILVKQLHVGLGHHSTADSAMDSIFELPVSIFNLHPLITLVTLTGLAIAIIHPRIKNKLIHFIPSSVWILVITIPLVFIYRNWITDLLGITSSALSYPESQLISFPSDLWSGLLFPNFGKVGTLGFWLVVFSIMIVTTIESLISTKAVDNLDPEQRKTNLNKDLIGVGLSTIVSGAIGGLPVITVIVRSSVNISNNGKTSNANFFHGLIVLFFVVALRPVLEEVPMAALAAILVYTGYRLASPREFADAYDRGEEQLLVMASTLLSVLIYGLLWGIFLGLCASFLVQWIKSRMNMRAFVMAIFRPKLNTHQLHDKYEVKMSGVFNFLNLLKVKGALRSAPSNERVEINMGDAILVDFTVMEYLNEYGKQYQEKGGEWEIAGLDIHETTSSHPNSMRTLSPQHQHSPRWMNQHQRELMKTAAYFGWQFAIGKEYGFSDLERFEFFRKHPIEYVHNVSSGLVEDYNLFFRVMDVVFDEGALQAKTLYDTTLMVIDLRMHIPEFVVDREELYDRIFSDSGFNDIDFEEDPEFSKRVLLSGTVPHLVRGLFTEPLRKFLLEHQQYHVEANTDQLLIFGDLKPLSSEEIKELYLFAYSLCSYLGQPKHEKKSAISEQP